MWLAYTHFCFYAHFFLKSTFYNRFLVRQSQAVFWGVFKINRFQTGIWPVTKFCQHKVNPSNYFTSKNFNKTSRILINSWKFDLGQNEFEKLNFLVLYILDLLSNTRIGVFAKSIEITLSIFTMCSDMLAKRIKLKLYQMKSHIP